MIKDAVKVDGLNQFVKGLKSLDRELPKALRKGLNEAVDLVVTSARSKVARRSGKAAASLRAGSTQKAARIVAGGSRAPYYPWLDFGGKVGPKHAVSRRFYRSGRYIYPALAERREETERLVSQAIVDAGRSAGIEVTSG
jgi:hypothetical protein